MPTAGTVLLVDDDEDMLAFLATELSRDVRVETARSGDEAWERLQRRRLPALIVSDLNMPGEIDGEGLTLRVSNEPRLANTPIILLTARDDAKLRERLLEMGASDYLVKPFPASELRIRVRNTLRLRNLLDELSDARDEAERAHATVLEINAELDRFASTVAHDLQAPLANISSFARLIREYSIEGDKHDRMLDAMADNADRARELIDDLLGHARTLGAHGAREEIDLVVATSRVLELLASQVDASGAHVTFPAVQARVRASELAVERILLNLIQNSIKYARPDVPPTIEVSADLSTDSDDLVEIVVADHGRGVPDGLKSRVLRHGQRGGRSAEEGSGIGLAAVRRVVGWYDGELWLTDRVDGERGLEVHFTLPAAP